MKSLTQRSVAGVLGLAARGPSGAEIVQGRFQAFDFEPHGASSGEGEGDGPLRRFAWVERQRQERQDTLLVGEVDPRDLSTLHVLNPHARLAANIALRLALRPDRVVPIEPIDDDGKPAVGLEIGHISDSQHRILQMGCDDGEILVVEGQELQVRHRGALPGSMLPLPRVIAGAAELRNRRATGVSLSAERHFRDADSKVKAGLALDANGLQNDAVSGAANQHVRAGADADSNIRAGADVVAFEGPVVELVG